MKQAGNTDFSSSSYAGSLDVTMRDESGKHPNRISVDSGDSPNKQEPSKGSLINQYLNHRKKQRKYKITHESFSAD